MATVKQLLLGKGSDVSTIQPDESVLEAIQKMADNNIGSLVVVENEKVVGIITERHYAREVALKGRRSLTTPVGQIMSTRVVCARPDQTIEQCMAVMVEKRIRHLPILDDDNLVGIVSIGDLVKCKIEDQKFLIEQLVHYIHG